jgi:LysM repeat protein
MFTAVAYRKFFEGCNGSVARRCKESIAKRVSLRITVCLLFLVIAIFGGEGYAQGNLSANTYTVKWGDTLARVAYRHYGDGKLYRRIAEANHLKSPHRIICGMVLVIPPQATGMLTAASSAPSKASAPPIRAASTLPETRTPQKQAAATASPELAPATTAQVASPLALQAQNPAPQFLWRREPCNVFCAGEKLTFDVKWKFITVGSATMEIQGIDAVSGRQAYHIVTDARSAPFFDSFYKVRDTNESWMDIESLVSLKYASHISENSTKRSETILLDHTKKQFQIVESGKTGEIPLWVQDVLSSLYYVRTRNLSVGEEISVDAHSGDKSWPLKVKVLRLETVNVPAGRFICYVVEPSIREGAGIFQAKGQLLVWLTADDKKVPVLMRSKIAVGAIEAELTKMQLK